MLDVQLGQKTWIKGLICNACLMLTSLFFFGKKENGTWEKGVLFSINDDPTDLIIAIEGFAKNYKEEAESVIDCFVNQENDD